MKKNIMGTLALLVSSLTLAQVNIPVNNGNVEDTAPMFQNKKNGKKWSLEGVFFNENANPTKFDAVNSGLAPGEGIDGSQAVKCKVINGNGAASEVTLIVGDTDISSYGPGTYTFTFQVKASEPVPSRPFWIVVTSVDNGKNMSNKILSTTDNGGTVSWKELADGYTPQSITVTVPDNAEGKSVKYLRLQIQHGIFTNTYWFDNFKLTKEQ